jgi:Flp pilus assembly protein TadD
MNGSILLIVLTFLLLVSGCKRGSNSTSGSSPGQSGASNAASPDPSQARSLLEKGKLLYRDDQDTEAAEAFKQAIALDPTLAEAHFRLGLTYETLNKSEEAEREYKSAVEGFKKYFGNEENEKDSEAHYILGQTYAGLQQYSDAIREFRQALKLRSDDPEIYYDLGAAHTKLAQYSEAVAAFSKSLELDPDNYRAQDALEEARDGVKRIQAGRKHQEDLLKKKEGDELKKAGEGAPGSSPAQPATPKGIKG